MRDAAYIAAVRDQATNMQNSARRLQAIYATPNAGSETWRNRASEEFVFWQTAYANAVATCAPARFSTVQTKWVAAMSAMNEAATLNLRAFDLYVEGSDARNPAILQLAIDTLKDANLHLRLATPLLSEATEEVNRSVR